MIRIGMVTYDNRDGYHRYADPEPDFGPAPTAVLDGLKNHPACEVHVVSCVKQPVRSLPKLADNIFFHAVVVRRWGWMRSGYLGCLAAVRKKLRTIRPDIVHGQGTEKYCALAAAHSGYPNVVTIHGNMAAVAPILGGGVGSFYWFAARLETHALKLTNGVLCNSAYTEKLVQPRARKTWRVPNALLPDYFANCPKRSAHGNPVMANVGHISPRKRQVELLQLADKLWLSGNKFKLEFFGNCNEKSDYGRTFLSLVRVAEQRGYAAFAGFRGSREIIRSLDEASALIHVPMEEAFGLVVGEGLARNIKFFGTRVGGVPEIAAEVEMAELFDLNDWEGLGRQIAAWLRAGCPTPTTAAAEMARRYHPAVIANRHLAIYSEVLCRNS